MPTSVGELKSPALVFVRDEDPVDQAADTMMSTGVSGAPVLDNDGHPVGFVTLAHLATRRQGDRVADRMTRPAIIIRQTVSVDEGARLMVRSGVSRVITVDDSGRATGVLTALDVLGALVHDAGESNFFPNHDDHCGVSFTDDRPLEMSELGVAPSGPGLLALVRGGAEINLTVVWSEAANNVRKRLWDMLSQPERETPQLARLLTSRRESLRFRAALVPDPMQRRRALELLRSEALKSRPVQ
jgi:hypothetical protein